MSKAGIVLPKTGLNPNSTDSSISLELVVDGSSQYLLRLTDEQGSTCRFSTFSDQKGFIYQGNVLGCSHP